MPSHHAPVGTPEAYVLGTTHPMTAARKISSPRATASVASVKRRDHKKRPCRYRWSKAYIESATAAHWRSLHKQSNDRRGAGLSPAPPGNVVGGDLFGADRTIPNSMPTIVGWKILHVRLPDTIPPCQNALEHLRDYLVLAEKPRPHSAEYAKAVPHQRTFTQ